MSYYSSISGQIKMTREAFEKFAKEKVDGIPVKEYLNTLDYVENAQTLILEREGTGYSDDELALLLAKYKDLPGTDMVEYSGEEYGDIGRFYIEQGRYCFVIAEPPPSPKVKEFWTYVEDCQK